MRQSLICGALLLLMAVAIPARAEVKIAYVDIQRALNECNNGKRARSNIRVEAQRAQASLQREQAQVQGLKDELDKKGMLMPPDQRQNLEDELAKKLRTFQDDVKNERDELHRKDNEATAAIVRDIATVVQQLGERNGYTVVMEKGGLLWGLPSADITEQVIRSYDSMNVKPGSLAANPRWAGTAPPATAGRGAATAPAGQAQPSIEGGSLRKHSSISK
ncbi:MAG TPA: OmpH family outer membrane protein [Candidatus Binataceae bacterium]|nr:OmpH family outer membrane protein [Candidatus Binataceae bacterium]